MMAMSSVDSLAGAEPWRKTFDFFDVDDSGTLSVENIRSCMTTFGQKVTTEHVRKMLRDAGVDEDGEVEYDEFVKLMTSDKARKVTMGAIRRYFDTLDKDGSGYITTAEMRHAYTTLGHGLTDRQMDLLIDRYDVDGNGELTFDEFVTFIKDGHGLDIDADIDDASTSSGSGHSSPPGAATPPPSTRSADDGEWVSVSDERVTDLLKPMTNADGKVNMADLQAAVALWAKSRDVPIDPENDPSLHWQKGRVKHGLGRTCRCPRVRWNLARAPTAATAAPRS